jgi:hypothetical protein
LSLHDSLFFTHVCRKDGQQTQEELQKRNLREELEERERKHYSSKDKSYAGIPTFLSRSFTFPFRICPRISHMLVYLLSLSRSFAFPFRICPRISF